MFLLHTIPYLKHQDQLKANLAHSNRVPLSSCFWSLPLLRWPIVGGCFICGHGFLKWNARPDWEKYKLSSTCLAQICSCAKIFSWHLAQMDDCAKIFGAHSVQMDDERREGRWAWSLHLLVSHKLMPGMDTRAQGIMPKHWRDRCMCASSLSPIVLRCKQWRHQIRYHTQFFALIYLTNKYSSVKRFSLLMCEWWQCKV